MQKLTRAEEELMQLIWEYAPCTVSDLISKMANPKPPHSTISSIVRILEKKGFLGHKAYGRTYEYFPLIDKKAYSKYSLKRLVSNYFSGSMNDMVSFLVEEDDLKLKDLNQIMEAVESDNNKSDKS